MISLIFLHPAIAVLIPAFRLSILIRLVDCIYTISSDDALIANKDNDKQL